jgi:hypothetical protein
MSKSKSKANYTELTHQVVRESPEPLPFVEIMWRVAEIAPITTRNPKGTIRTAISQSRLIVATGDGRYGWLPHLITGSALRLTLSPRDIAGQGLEFGDEVRDVLWPSFFEAQKRNDRRPVQVRLRMAPSPGGRWISLASRAGAPPARRSSGAGSNI